MLEPKPPTWRLFAAVFPPADALTELSRWLAPRWAAPVVPGLRWIGVDSLHLTLRFFGSVLETRASELSAACARAAASGQPFELQLRAGGAFPSARRARVVWLGVAVGAGELTQLAAALETEAAPLGWPAAEHAFTPHLSLARLSTARDVSPLLAALQAVDVRMPVTRLALVRSRLGGPAARYEVLESFALGTGHANVPG